MVSSIEHHLESNYLARLARFEPLNPPGFRFLKRLQDEGPQHGLWLSTASNAHLYKHDAYLAYLCLEGPKQKASALSLAPKFNQQYASHAVDRSGLLFPSTVKKLVMQHKGFSQKWAVSKAGIAIELAAGTPDAFYSKLFSALVELDTAVAVTAAVAAAPLATT
jgi:hypothetical protein